MGGDVPRPGAVAPFCPWVWPGEVAVYGSARHSLASKASTKEETTDAYEGPVHFGRVNDGCREP
jgi:hypothetical protein